MSIDRKKLSFVQFDSPAAKRMLYTPCEKLENISSSNVQELIASMKDAMNGVGVGLAANQVGK